MHEKIFLSKSTFKKWLITATGVVLTSVSLMSDVKHIEFQFSSPKALSTVMEGSPSYFPDGAYKVTFQSSDEIVQEDLDYSKMAMVISFEAKQANSNILIGGLKPLLKELADYTYCCSIERTNPAFITAGIWVVEPIEPEEIKVLKAILDKNSVMYAFNDGTGFVTLNNARMGKGMSQIVKI